jgi:hypothetical protein
MFWLLFLALMILVPLLAGVHTWHEQRQKATIVGEAARSSRSERNSDVLPVPGSPRL